jgi:hypothetical protein
MWLNYRNGTSDYVKLGIRNSVFYFSGTKCESKLPHAREQVRQKYLDAIP